MMLLKIISLSLSSCLYFQNFVTPLNQCVYKNDKHIYVETPNDIQYEYHGEQYKLVASLPDKNIKLFAIESCNYQGFYDKFLISVNGRRKLFRWESLAGIQWSPQLILSDINNDKVEELIVILTTNSGTGYHEEEFHIINMNNFYEYLITNPLIIIKEKVTTQITKREEDVLIQVKLNDKEHNIIREKSYAKFVFDNVFFGNVIHWEVTDNKLYARVGAQTSPGGFIGNVVIQYKYNSENEFFNLDNISFEEYP